MSALRRVLEADGYKDFPSLHLSLLADPTQIGTFLSDDSSRVMFLENFPTCADNLLCFLEYNATRSVSGKSSAKRSIACEAIFLAVSVLSFPEFDFVGHAARAKLVAGILTRALHYQPFSLKALAKELTKKPGFLECVASSEDGAQAISDLFSVHFVTKLPSIGYTWADKLSTLCSLCDGIPTLHGIPALIDRWHTLRELVATLNRYQRMREMSRDDGHLSTEEAQWKNSIPAIKNPPLPDNIISLLGKLQIQTYRSSSSAAKLLDIIQDIEIPALVHKLLATFPCRPCYELSADPKAPSGKGKQVPGNRADSGSSASAAPPAPEAADFLGGEIGLWKMLLSAEALKDIRKYIPSGMYLSMHYLRIHRDAELPRAYGYSRSPIAPTSLW